MRPALYGRPLSGSEIHAIYSATNSGKFDPATNAPLNLAKAQVSVGGGASDIFYGANTNWQTRTVSFIATGAARRFNSVVWNRACCWTASR